MTVFKYRRLFIEDIEGNLRDVQLLFDGLLRQKQIVAIERIEPALENPNAYTFGAFDGSTLVGIASVHVVPMLMRTVGFIENVVVLESHRGKGISKELLHRVVKVARTAGCTYCELTCAPDRTEANRLYQSFGFTQRATNVYRLQW